MIVEFVAAFRDEHGVDPICAALRDTAAQIAPSTVRAHLSSRRVEAPRVVRDREILGEIRTVHADNLGVYGARKVHAELRRKGIGVARCTVERLMKADGLQGITRSKTRKTTHSEGAETPQPADRVERQFTAAAPNALWVADLTYIRTHSGWVYAAFILDVFSRMVVGWQVSTTMHTDLALDALDMGLWARSRAGQGVAGLIHHSDRGVRYRAIRYTERLAEADAVTSVGSKGDSYDNAMAEAFNSLFKAECIRNPVMRPRGGWGGVGEVEIAVAEYIDWFNHRRLHGEIGHVPPVEYETTYWSTHTVTSYRENPVPAVAGTK
ncbi:putative transposase [Gordonia alkanivorans NBRC 16433]|uniref:Integrase n=3 Tax=Gordonia TaxID=2053 RepID=W9DF54_9ACTN|nr:integrase [Gordonia alkanivorans CGMCC 6845]GAA12479.1 putative transposase [Gordonia alkanivorans NBRC 16433]